MVAWVNTIFKMQYIVGSSFKFNGDEELLSRDSDRLVTNKSWFFILTFEVLQDLSSNYLLYDISLETTTNDYSLSLAKSLLVHILLTTGINLSLYICNLKFT